MAKYAYVENGQVTEVYEQLPNDWRNVSNLQSLVNDPQALATIGWYVVEEPTIYINPNTQRLSSPTYVLEDGKVRAQYDILSAVIAPPPVKPAVNWDEVRKRRDTLMSAMSWRYDRYARNARLGLPQQDNIQAMDKYMQELATITDSFPAPYAVLWPTYNPEQ